MENINSNKKGFYSILVMIVYLWAGMLIGISFLEAPLKFNAPNITLALGLGIGRLVFGALNKIEILFALSFISIFFYLKLSFGRIGKIFIVILSILILQTLWLLPALDARAEAIINGNLPAGPSPHIYYILAETAKLILLIILGIRIHRQSIKTSQQNL